MTRRRVLVLSGYGLGGLVFLFVLLLALLWVVQAGSILPRTTVAGVDVSGQSPEQARETLAPLAEQRRDSPIVFVHEDERFEVVPTDVGYSLDLDASIEVALSRGREGFPGDIVERLRSLRTFNDVELLDDFDAAAVEARVEEISAGVDREISSGTVSVDPEDLQVSYELPHGSVEVRRDEAVELLTAALHAPGSDELELPVDTEPQLVSDEDLRAVAAQMERALSAPLELVAGEEELVLDPDQIRQVAAVVERGSTDDLTVALEVSVSALVDVLDGEDLDRFATEPRNASFSASRTPPSTYDVQGSGSFSPVSADVEVEPSSDGTSFDPDLAAEQITELLRAGQRRAELRLATAQAELTTEQAHELQPTHLLGTFTTYHPSGQPRVHNIQLLADTVNGTVLLPGEQFSINEISGERSCAKGYREDGMILRGDLVQVCGGGTSQFGTTIFNAAFFSGVQLDAWKAHSWYFSRYPMGREATLNYPDLDVRFTNTTPAAIIVKTTHTPGSITVSLYGQPIANAVSAAHGNPSNRTEPSVERVSNPDTCEGEERVERAGFGGFTVQVHTNG